MESTEAGANSDRAELEGSGTNTPLAPASSESPARRRIWMIVLTAGALAGLLACVAGELSHDFFRPRRYKVEVTGMSSMQPSRESQNAADLANAMLTFAILGSVTALIMGLAGGFAGRNLWRGAMVGLGSQAVGALAGAACSWALIPIFARQLVPDQNDLFTPILIHGGIWMAIGAVGGMAFAAGMGAWRQLPITAVCACVGAFTASVIFHLLVGMLFPHSSPSEPVGSTAVARLMASSLFTILVAIGVARGALGRVPLRLSHSGPAH